jgi:tetratricopeptide (TPR) repeat protein
MVISKAFDQFKAVLGAESHELDVALLSEINLSINGSPFNRARLEHAIVVFNNRFDDNGLTRESLLYAIGNAHLGLGQLVEAKEAYLGALVLFDDSDTVGLEARCTKNLGATLEKLGEEEAARALYERALELDPLMPEAHLALAHWHRRNSNDALAEIRHLDAVVEQRDSATQMSSVHAWRLDALFRVGEVAAAFRDVSALSRDAGTADWVWNWCAQRVAKFGKESTTAAAASVRFWRNYLRAHPHNPAAGRELVLCACVLRMAGVTADLTFPECKRMVVELIDADAHDPGYLWDRIGHWAEKDEDWAEAESAFRQAYDIDPERFACCLSVALNALGRPAEVIVILGRLASTGVQDASCWFQLGTAHSKLEDFPSAAHAFERAIELDEQYAVAWFNLGGALLNAGDLHSAAQAWGEAVRRFPEHKLVSVVRADYDWLLGAASE